HLSMMQSGERMRLLADDPMAQIDVPHFCTTAGHRLISQEKNGDQLIFLIERA
ncbi:MAG: sulfurtransferase TusA family protein, partial [Rhodobacteraceae bacterium]|nr:sulfurtransferase TusA family protein [Paracoccaceae bacterium]